MSYLPEIPYTIVVDVLKKVGFRTVPRGTYLLMRREDHIVVIAKVNGTDEYTLGKVMKI